MRRKPPWREQNHRGIHHDETTIQIGKLNNAYKRQLRNDNTQHGQEVDGEICQVVMGVMCAQQEKHNGHTQQELFGRSVLCAIVYLLPHVQVVVCAGVKFKRDAPDVMKHDV